MSEAPTPCRVAEPIEYAVHDGVSLKGDLYLPATAGPHPVVVATPGGAWRMANRAGLGHWCEYLASRDIATFAIEYRTSKTGATFPRAALDVIAALEFVAGSARALGVDGARVALLGASAGAHLAALAALAGGQKPFRSAYPSDANSGLNPPLRALVLAYGVYDLAAHWHATRAEVAAGAEDVTLNFMGTPLGGAEVLYRSGSPIEYVAAARSLPPVLLTWGDADQLVRPEQSQAFATTLIGAGAEVTQVPIVGAGHHWFSQHAMDDASGFTAALAPVVYGFLAGLLER